MQWTISHIREVLGGKLVGNLPMREIVCKTILVLPANYIDIVCKTVWFISSPEDSWAFTFKGADIKNRSLVFLSDELLRQENRQISFTILHEIGHVILNHRNSIGFEQTESEIKEQEIEADAFANSYIGNLGY